MQQYLDLMCIQLKPRSALCSKACAAFCQKGLSVGFMTAAALVHQLREASDEKRFLENAQKPGETARQDLKTDVGVAYWLC